MKQLRTNTERYQILAARAIARGDMRRAFERAAQAEVAAQSAGHILHVPVKLSEDVSGYYKDQSVSADRLTQYTEQHKLI